MEMDGLMKDDQLQRLIFNGYNVAQFISFDNVYNEDSVNRPIEQRFVNIKGVSGLNKVTNTTVGTKTLLKKLINASTNHLINIRKYKPDKMAGNEVFMGLTYKDIDYAMEILTNNAKEGFYSIVNENIDINDGGVSGVILAGMVEFAPKDTPRCVDKPNVARLPVSMADKLFKIVYGIETNFKDIPANNRVEFSIHPNLEGVNEEHIIYWEVTPMYNIGKSVGSINFNNRFSEFLGDKTYGLLIAHLMGFNVPDTKVFHKQIDPFDFGYRGRVPETFMLRPSPTSKQPGMYDTIKCKGSDLSIINDIFKLLRDPNIASILKQNGIDAKYSGATLISSEESFSEGVVGEGSKFMIGEERPEDLPDYVKKELDLVVNDLRDLISLNYIPDLHIEWVYAGEKIWILQMTLVQNYSFKHNVIVEGEVSAYVAYDTNRGLDGLRDLIRKTKNDDIGVVLVGNVGITSHFGDLLRRDNIPSRIEIGGYEEGVVDASRS